MLLRAPAKINLSLRILSKRADGYHEISSLMRAIRLFDDVGISFSGRGAGGAGERGRPRFALNVPGDAEGVPSGSDNLAYRAAELAAEAWGRNECPGELPGGAGRNIDIALTKRIPAAAGLAGGSADAAAVLLGLAKGLNTGAALAEVAALGASLGADVPFCVYSCAAANPSLGYEGAGAALAEGIGERISPITAPESGWVVLVKPRAEVRSGEIYAMYDARQNPAPLAHGNDLEAPCAEARPAVAEVLSGMKKICAEEAEEAGGCPRGAKCQLSGSGPTVFAYFPETDPNAQTLAACVYRRAKTAFPDMFTHLTETL